MTTLQTFILTVGSLAAFIGGIWIGAHKDTWKHRKLFDTIMTLVAFVLLLTGIIILQLR